MRLARVASSHFRKQWCCEVHVKELGYLLWMVNSWGLSCHLSPVKWLSLTWRKPMGRQVQMSTVGSLLWVGQSWVHLVMMVIYALLFPHAWKWDPYFTFFSSSTSHTLWLWICAAKEWIAVVLHLGKVLQMQFMVESSDTVWFVVLHWTVWHEAPPEKASFLGLHSWRWQCSAPCGPELTGVSVESAWKNAKKTSLRT